MPCCIPSRAEFIIDDQMRELRRLALAARAERLRQDAEEVEFRRRERERQLIEMKRAANAAAWRSCPSLRRAGAAAMA